MSTFTTRLLQLASPLLFTALLSTAANAQYSYLPTASTTDGRFLSVAGSGFNTITGDTMSIAMATMNTEDTLEFALFDGETGGMWDQGTTPLTYRLYADPAGTGIGTTLLGTWSGSTMSDNAWYQIKVASSPAAAASSGNYRYVLKVYSSNVAAVHLSAFKVRVLGVLALIKDQSFNFLAPLSQQSEANVIYPSYPALSPTTYDGTWEFYLDVPQRLSAFAAWDGDMDFGNWVNDTTDSNDPDTPGTLPPWATSTAARPEGVAIGDTTGGVARTGYPTDNSRYQIFMRGPSVMYSLFVPGGASFLNSNPSGNLEWEQFRLSTAAFNSSTMDYHADSLPSGTYQVFVNGLDLGNMGAAWRFSHDVLGVDTGGNPTGPGPLEVTPPGGDVTLNVTTCWPPNHQMVTITARVTATDNRDDAIIVLESVTSNEPDNGLGDGDTQNDIQGVTTGTRDTSFSLRCERSGRGDGRVYTIVYRFTDSAGNVSRDTARFTIPKSQGKNKKESIETGAELSEYSVSLGQNYPNPFVRETDIKYTVREAGAVSMEVYTINGELVRTLSNGTMEPGEYTQHWDGRDESGREVAAGSYMLVVRSGDCQCGQTMEMVLTGGGR